MKFLYFQSLSLKVIEMLSFFQLTLSLLVKGGSFCPDVRDGGSEVQKLVAQLQYLPLSVTQRESTASMCKSLALITNTGKK